MESGAPLSPAPQSRWLWTASVLTLNAPPMPVVVSVVPFHLLRLDPSAM